MNLAGACLHPRREQLGKSVSTTWKDVEQGLANVFLLNRWGLSGLREGGDRLGLGVRQNHSESNILPPERQSPRDLAFYWEKILV